MYSRSCTCKIPPVPRPMPTQPFCGLKSVLSGSWINVSRANQVVKREGSFAVVQAYKGRDNKAQWGWLSGQFRGGAVVQWHGYATMPHAHVPVYKTCTLYVECKMVHTGAYIHALYGGQVLYMVNARILSSDLCKACHFLVQCTLVQAVLLPN